MRKANINFRKYTDHAFSQEVANILSSMAENIAIFPDPVPALSVVSADHAAFKAALTKVFVGSSKADTAKKNELRHVLEKDLAALGTYVQQVSTGEESIILTSGFRANKQPSPVGPLPPPEEFRAIIKYKGQVKLMTKPVDGASSYKWEYKLKNGTEWLDETTTAAKKMLKGLTSGLEYDFRVVAIGANEARNYSDIISSFVL